MKSSIVLIGGLTLAATATAAATCNADNCARAVTGTLRQLTATHYGDCQSFMACTATPPAVTVTDTVTFTPSAAVSTVTAGPFPENYKRGDAPGTSVVNCPSAMPNYASACSGQTRYSSACSCFGATQSTTTLTALTVTTSVTVTPPARVSTATVPPSAPSLCGNAGLQWAYFYDNSPDASNPQEEAYDPAKHKTQTPQRTGVTDYLHFRDTENTVYGANLNNYYFALEHRGYLFAPETGTYTFTVSNVDNNLYMWLGSEAYSGWTKGNAQQYARWDVTQYVQGAGSFYLDLTAGEYYPLRIVYEQGSSVGSFDYTITAPSGYTLIGNDKANAKNTPFIVQYGCEGGNAPAYPPFGRET